MGLWTDIVEIIAPSSATSGEQVSISIKVKNILTYAFSIGVSVAVNGGFATLTPALTQPGATTTFSASTIMPNRDVTVTITSYFVVSEYEWYPDDEQSVVITLAEVFTGKISRKELEYNGARSAIPVR